MLKVPFLHKKNPGKMIWWDVPEPLPPTFRIPFPTDKINLDAGVSMNGEDVRIAEFELGELVTSPEGRVQAYAFKQWV